jgi:hypothetical protein
MQYADLAGFVFNLPGLVLAKNGEKTMQYADLAGFVFNLPGLVLAKNGDFRFRKRKARTYVIYFEKQSVRLAFKCNTIIPNMEQAEDSCWIDNGSLGL